MSSYSELIGARLTDVEIAQELDADSVNYLPIEEYIRETGMHHRQLCLGCITGEYPTPLANEIAEKNSSFLAQDGAEQGRIYET
jgi:amidophosphoribosyltransferase